MASNPNISTSAPSGLAAATAANTSSSSSSASNPSFLNHSQHIPLRSKPSGTSEYDESADMTATATRHMQDLGVTDRNNTTSSIMRFEAAATPEPMELSNGRKFGEEPAPPTTYLRQVPPTQTALPAGLRPSQANGLTTLASQQGFDEETRQRYCYRHRPDLWNGRQVEEPSMDQLKTELSSVPEAEQQGISEVWSSFSKAPAKQRELMLRGLLAQCCFPQLSFLAGSVRELLKIDFLSALPPELGLRILCFLDSRSLCHAAQVSRKWKEMADDDVVWHRMCEQHIDRKCTTCGWGLPLLDRERLRSERRNLQMRLVQETAPLPTTHTKSAISHTEIYEYPDSASDDNEHGPTPKSGKKRGAAAVMPAKPVTVKKSCTPAHNYEGAEQYFPPTTQILTPRPWKDVYRDRFKIGTNWKHGRCSLKVLKGHTNGVMCLQFDDQIIVSGSYDTTIRIWDIESGELLRTLTGHTLGVKCLQFDKSKLVSGSLDGTLKMWDIKTGKVIRTFPGHSGAVISVHFDGSILASGSQDKTIRVRDFANCSRVSLRGHTDWVNSVRVDAASQTLFSASDDCTVRIWDLAAKRCVRVLRDHSAQVQQVLPLPYGFEVEGNIDNSESDSDSSSSRVSSSSTNSDRSVAVPIAIPDRLKHHGHDPPRYILTGSLDSTIRLWEVSTGRCIRTFFGHIEGIWALAADTLRMVSGANDGLVKIWDPRTGKHERTISGHDGPVTCVGLSDRRLVTGSEDTEIRLYNFENTTPEPLKDALSTTTAPPPTSSNKQDGNMEL